MSDTLAAVLSVSILLLAAGLFVWAMARARHERALARVHVDRQLAQSRAPAAVPLRAGSFPAPAETAPGAGPLTGARDGALAAWELPPWTLGAVPAAAVLLVPAAILAGAGAVAMAAGALAAVAFLAAAAVAAGFAAWLRLQSRRRLLVSQLPAFMEAMVRLITIGNSTQSAFQTAAANTKAPLRAYMDRVSGMQRAGIELEPALLQVAQSIRIDELVLLASVLGLGVRYGGRADLLLERMAGFMRDEEQAGRELQAMSAEVRMSAWVLGLMPVVVGAAIIMINAAYFTMMWSDASGRAMMLAAIGLQVAGALILWRLARVE